MGVLGLTSPEARVGVRASAVPVVLSEVPEPWFWRESM